MQSPKILQLIIPEYMVELHFRIIVFPRNSISSQKKQTSEKQKSSRFLDSVWMCPRSDAEKAWVSPRIGSVHVACAEGCVGAHAPLFITRAGQGHVQETFSFLPGPPAGHSHCQPESPITGVQPKISAGPLSMKNAYNHIKCLWGMKTRLSESGRNAGCLLVCFVT